MNLDVKQNDFAQKIDLYKNDCKAIDRYASFDYCYNFFKTTEDLTADMEKSCLAIGFYLASWGMFRGSSFLLNPGKSLKHFQPLIEYVAELDKSVWLIDVDKYDNTNIELMCEIYEKTKEVAENHTHLTLTTKILLGIFGFTPAFDSYFCKTFSRIFNGGGFHTFKPTALKNISQFYEAHKIEIDDYANSIFTFDFMTANQSDIHYPKAKIIDMYGFASEYYGTKPIKTS